MNRTGDNAPQLAEDASYLLLEELPPDHALRKLPLGSIGAQCRNRLSKEWRDLARWRIASCSFDDLGESWTSTSEFRIKGP
jgi:hypothetical protein